MHRRAALVPLLAGALVAACAPDRAGSGGEVAEAERYGGTAVVALIADPQTMNSLVTSETFSRLLQRDVLFMPLVRYDAALEPMPWLAERWDTVRVAPDTLQLSFHLRRDVRWHDGVATTAEDVLFTYDRVRDPAVASSLAASFAYYAAQGTLVDPHTVRFRLRAHADFLDGWAQLPIMPRHILGEVAPDRLAQHPFGASQPVGNGAFRFVRRLPGQEWVFEANPDFPAGLGGRPYLDRLVVRVIPEATTLNTELITGGIDLYFPVHAVQAAQLEGAASARLISSPTSEWAFIGWNTRLPFFDTSEERRALTMAIDRQAIVRALLPPGTVVGRSTVTPAHWSFEGEDPRTSLPYAPDSARLLLGRAGWSDRSGDGMLRDTADRPFRFTLLLPQGNENARGVAEIVQAQLRAVGIDVQPRVVEGNALIGHLMGSLNPHGERERQFEAVVMGWSDSFRKEDANLFHSRNRDQPFQISGFSNPRVDALLDTLSLIVDRQEARPLWREYQALLANEAPKTVIYYPSRLTGVHRRLRGVEIDARGELTTVSRWWIDPAERRRGAP